MDKIVVAFVAALGVAFVFFLAMLASTFFGALGGMVVGLVFPYVTDALRELSGLQLTDWQIGATLGFFGSAFRSSNNCDCD